MRKFLCALGLFSIFILITPLAMPQSLVSGDISGTVSDPSGAVIKDAVVNIKSLDTGTSQTTATGNTGSYRFSLLRPGRYSVKVAQQGFQGAEQQVSVNIGQTTTTNFVLTVGKASEIVEVTGALPIVNTESANSTTAFTQRDVSTLPNPGGDLTNIAQTAPGVTMNTSGGYGNFTANGMPATSNLFTVNGENNMDPFFNINNSGATNLTLGLNEIQEATVVTNPYSGQYGQQAGAQVNYITKSGTNAFHGSAKYLWNGRIMNANDWFANNGGTPRPFANNNQWGADFGGPIRKDKTFFYVNTEGLRYILPTVQNAYIPSPQFASAVLSNIATVEPASLPMYQKLMNVWTHPNSPGAQNAAPIANSCDSDVIGALPGITANTPCAYGFSATPGQLSTEWIISGRLDHNFSDNDRVFARFRRDDGLQPTYTDPVSSNFNATSQQPSYDGQLQWNHIFSGNTTNQFIMAGTWYTAVFKQNEDLANSTFPYGVQWLSSIFSTMNQGGGYFGRNWSFPQGRNVTQYQFVDDLSKVVGNHALKFGANFRRYDVSDFNFFYKHPRVYFDSLLGFANGQSNQFRQWFSDTSGVPIAMYGLGVYGQDEWRVNNSLKLTLALRLEHNSNPVCQSDCFSQFVAPFQSLTLGPDVPYNQNIQTGLNQAYRATDKLNFSPRLGFIWSPLGNGKTVISGGVGIFYDALSQGIIEPAFQRVPGALWADPTNAGGPAIAAASAAALKAGFASGATYNSLKAELGKMYRSPTFTNFVGTFHTPQYQEWNLQVQQDIGGNMSLTLGYTGVHGIHIPINNGALNAWDNNGYGAGFPTTVPDKSYATVNQWATIASSNANNLTFGFQRRFSQGLSVQANYTWGHALDEVSNGGAFVYGSDSLIGQLNPASLRANNYGNADYDIRHNFTGTFVWEPPHKFSNSIVNGLMGGWSFSSSIFARSGSPYTVLDANTVGAFANYYGGAGYFPAQPLGPGATFGQGSCSNPSSQCFDPNAFLDASSSGYTVFPTQRRNQYRGPGLFDANFSPMKNFNLTERMKLRVGANFYNIFNHPNFYLPNMYLSTGDPTVGTIYQSVGGPASIMARL
jgi:carboxypeptidase family protein/TonB-dependent receptor-like protein